MMKIQINAVTNGYVVTEILSETSERRWIFADVKELVQWLVPKLLSGLPNKED